MNFQRIFSKKEKSLGWSTSVEREMKEKRNEKE